MRVDLVRLATVSSMNSAKNSSLVKNNNNVAFADNSLMKMQNIPSFAFKATLIDVQDEKNINFEAYSHQNKAMAKLENMKFLAVLHDVHNDKFKTISRKPLEEGFLTIHKKRSNNLYIALENYASSTVKCRLNNEDKTAYITERFHGADRSVAYLIDTELKQLNKATVIDEKTNQEMHYYYENGQLTKAERIARPSKGNSYLKLEFIFDEHQKLVSKNYTFVEDKSKKCE